MRKAGSACQNPLSDDHRCDGRANRVEVRGKALAADFAKSSCGGIARDCLGESISVYVTIRDVGARDASYVAPALASWGSTEVDRTDILTSMDLLPAAGGRRRRPDLLRESCRAAYYVIPASWGASLSVSD